MSTKNPVFLCPLRAGVECQPKHRPCSRCGWSYGEEMRRKSIIKQLRAMGQYNGTIKV